MLLNGEPLAAHCLDGSTFFAPGDSLKDANLKSEVLRKSNSLRSFVNQFGRAQPLLKWLRLPHGTLHLPEMPGKGLLAGRSVGALVDRTLGL